MKRIVIALAFAFVGVTLGAAQPTTAATCIIGPVTKTATFKYIDRYDYEMTGIAYYAYVKIKATACYNNTTSFGVSISVSHYGDRAYLGYDSGPRYSTYNGKTTFLYDPVFASSFGYELHLHPRVAISKTGAWSAFDASSHMTGHNGKPIMYGEFFEPIFVSWWWS